MSVDENTHTSLIDSTQELHKIRSHRAARRRVHVSRRFTLAAAAVLACAALMPLGAGTGSTPVAAEAPPTIQTVVSPRPERVLQVSRSLARKLATPTRAQKINKVINYAMAQRGDRYRYGAAGPSKWDCSGLVMMAYRQIGIKLPHQTGGILHKGKRVTRSHMQRGDLVFLSSHHVGIYIGGNKMIVASSGHGKVMVQTVYAFYTARRIL